MTLDELKKDYFATMQQDAEHSYEDEHGDYAPEPEGFDDRALKDGEEFLRSFHEAFPDSKTEGGNLYIGRLYDDADLPKDERKWLASDDWYTDATATIGEDVDGKYWVFFE